MGSQADGLDNLSDLASLNQLGGACHGGNFESLGKIDRPDAAGFGHHPLDIIELHLRRTTRFVDHHILAMLHGLNGEGRTV